MPAPDAITWMNYVQTLSWAGAALTAALGLWGFSVEQRKSRRQRESEIAERKEANAAAARELQWRQAGAAQVSLEKFEADPRAADAMLMLDWDGRWFPSGGPEQWQLRKNDVLEALRTKGKPFSTAEIYVRDSFDRFLWHFERIQSQIDVELITLAHVRFPIAYWVALMDEDKNVFDGFLEAYGYTGAITLMEALRMEGLPVVAPNYEKLFNLPKDSRTARPSHSGSQGQAGKPG
jgi:hypothetical protein